MLNFNERFNLFTGRLTNVRVLNDLSRRSYIGIFFISLLGVTIFYTYKFNHRHPELLITFLGPLITICSFRVVQLVFFPYLTRRFPLQNSLVFIASVLFTALCWGSGFATIMSMSNEYPTQILMCIVSAGICSGGVVAFLPNRFISFGYNACIMWPVAGYMCLFSTSKIAGVFFFLYSAYLSVQTVKGNQEYWLAISNEERLRQQSRELAVLSRVDVLTGLFNRRHFEELYEQEWNKAVRHNSPLSLLVCDLDNFKLVNDRYGHLAGDEILRGTAENLNTVFKRITDIVCRFGGEEFVILLDVESEKAYRLAEKMCRLQEEKKFRYQQQEIATTISIGIASTIPDVGARQDELFAQADAALYQAKNTGKNKAVVA